MCDKVQGHKHKDAKKISKRAKEKVLRKKLRRKGEIPSRRR